MISIIVPIYNTEKYLRKCLDSIYNQTYKNYELILVNDGSTDNSLDIINEYKSRFDNIKIINQENQGLSTARNNGIKISKGDYFLLVDSDDYIDSDLLEKLSKCILNVPDLVRFQVREVTKCEKIDYKEIKSFNLSGKDAFKLISNFHYVENAWCYLYNKKFYTKNKFEFKKNRYHEDFGLIPLVIVKSNIVNIIDYVGYNYVQHENSIMSTKDYLKIRKKAFDTLEQYKELIKYDGGDIYKSFLSNSVILKLKDLNKEDFKIYLKELKKENCFNYILDDTFIRKIKKILMKINIKIYLKMR